MKKLLVLCALLAAGSSWAINWNSQNAKEIEASINSKSVEQKYIAAGLIAMIGKNPDNIDYQTFKKEWMAAVATRKEKSRYYEWYIVYAVPQAVCSISRFNSFAKDVIKDPQYAKVYFVNSRMLVSYPQYYDPAEWRIKALALLSRNDYFLSRRMFDGYLKLMKHYSKDEIKSDLQTIKRAVDRNKGKMRDWEKFAAAVDKVIARYQDK
ncbi:MAG: hypothetical protein E7058_02665 [Lentisphaerae bacterium]|nr:hypothetical protein [Lentisphaerota bacterium]